MSRPLSWLRSSVRALRYINPLSLFRFLAGRQNPAGPGAVGPGLSADSVPAIIGAVELGGTTCVAATASSENPTQIIDSLEIPTTTPHETVAKLTAWLDARAPFAALGIASFGPIDLNQNSKTYGFITTTPKPNWASFHLLQAFYHYKVPIAFDTDVNAPALAEFVHGSHGADVTSCAYITVGTGIGVGLVVNGAPVHGLMHPEGGHIMPLRHPHDTYQGFTKLHSSSVESMAAAQACAERCSVAPRDLPTVSDAHPAWDFVAYYLAQLCVSVMFTVSPHVIVLSGGIMQRQSLFPRIRKHFAALNDGYVNVPRIVNELDQYIVPSTFGDDCGIIGALELARRILHSR